MINRFPGSTNDSTALLTTDVLTTAVIAVLNDKEGITLGTVKVDKITTESTEESREQNRGNKIEDESGE